MERLFKSSKVTAVEFSRQISKTPTNGCGCLHMLGTKMIRVGDKR